uniref:DUF4350 domain-containing protein n=1 Tax=uncultured Thiotrichaceae bacterium TaxID=298394 RepID=A0A6S6TLR9_9GAMM|nr:MAG: Unknown protein [uncultured Thiotrichaceae bacterium]
MKFQNLLYAIFAVTILAAGTAWFLQNFELETVDEFTGYKGEARENSLFAARLFGKQMGIPMERHDGLASFPDTDTVIVLNTERFSLSDGKITELLDWVSQGGHLITRARVDLESQADAEEKTGSETEDRDILQARLGIRIGAHELPDKGELPAKIRLNNSPETIDVEVDFFNGLETDNKNIRSHQLAGANWLIQQPHDEGLVTMVSTLDMIENSFIENADHGKFFFYLLQSHDPDYQQVWLVHQDTLPHLFVLLVRHAGALLIVLGLLLLFTFWSLMPRFGALIPEPPPERRRILDHIQASGQFLWKKQKHGPEQLCTAVQHNIQQQAQRHIPGWQFMSATEQQQTLAELVDWPDTELNKLERLLQAKTLNEAGFTSLVKLAHRLRNHA